MLEREVTNYRNTKPTIKEIYTFICYTLYNKSKGGVLLV